jgi:hypothetical protein
MESEGKRNWKPDACTGARLAVSPWRPRVEKRVPDFAALHRRIGFAGPFSLEIEFKGPDSNDPSAEIIDEGIAKSYRFMKNLKLGEPT